MKFNSSPRNLNTHNAHVLKTKVHDDFSKDPNLAIINLSRQHLDIDAVISLFTSCLKFKNIKKNISIFSENLNISPKNTSKYIQKYNDNIIALTEKPGGWLLRCSSGENYSSQACLIILDTPINLRQSENLLIQNLDAHGYLEPKELNTELNLGIKLHANYSAVSAYPRISEKLFILPGEKIATESINLIIESLWR